ncbi:MAG TPA: NUDIX hydrolase [Candidatus Andersenbacteria bacterium]|nr:NUDIX hydrolase [Candidatus Andersenbacteria bacterium]
MVQKWKVLDSQWALNEKWYKVRRDTLEIKPDQVIDYYIGIFPDVVMTIAVTPDNNVLLVRQYKHGVGDVIIELPAGVIDEGEDPLDAAKRELREETGYVASQWQELGYFSRTPGKSRGGNVRIYLANNASKTGDQEFDENEDIEVILKPFPKALAMAKNGELQGIDTVLGLFLAEEKLK